MPKKLTEKHKANIAKSHIGIRPNEETRKRLSEMRKGKPLNFSPEVLEKLSKYSRERWANPEYVKRMIETRKGRKMKESSRLKLIESKMGHTCSDETRRKIGLKSSERLADPAYMAKHKKAISGWHCTDEMKEKQREISKKLWENPEYGHKVLSGVCQRPNKKEALLLDIINEVAPDQYRYTGDGSFSIYNLHPDFTNCNGQKKVIEHYGKYWHKGQNPQDRIDKFALFGYKCLVIWEYELKNRDDVAAKVKIFNDG